ncbi:MAG: hypothetical protein ACTSUE_01445 [Promethearchaeota archaeon]
MEEKRTRRSDVELVTELVNYLKGVKGTITQGELTQELGINSETAEKWLKILQIVKYFCPDFQYMKVGRYWIIKHFPEMTSDETKLWKQRIREMTMHPFSPPPRSSRPEAIKTFEKKLIEMAVDGIQNLKSMLKNPPERGRATEALINSLRESIVRNIDSLKSPKDEMNNILLEEFGAQLNRRVSWLNSSLRTASESDVRELQMIESEFRNKVAMRFTLFDEYDLSQLPEDASLDDVRKNIADYLMGNVEDGRKTSIERKAKERAAKTIMGDTSDRGKIINELRRKFYAGVELDHPDDMNHAPDEELIIHSAVLYCQNCNVEAPLPTHCWTGDSNVMVWEGDKFVCEKCKETASIPRCPGCSEKMGVLIKVERE